MNKSKKNKENKPLEIGSPVIERDEFDALIKKVLSVPPPKKSEKKSKKQRQKENKHEE